MRIVQSRSCNPRRSLVADARRGTPEAFHSGGVAEVRGLPQHALAEARRVVSADRGRCQFHLPELHQVDTDTGPSRYHISTRARSSAPARPRCSGLLAATSVG